MKINSKTIFFLSFPVESGEEDKEIIRKELTQK